MAIAPIEAYQEPAGFLASVQAALQDFSARFQQDCLLQSPKELAATVAGIEEISKSVEQLQVIGAHAVDQQNIAQTGETDQSIPWADPVQGTGQDGKPKKPEYKDAAEYLRQKLKISRGEAKRRLRVGSSTMPSTLMTGEQAPPKLERLGAALTSSKISGQAATLIRDALERVRPTAPPAGLAAMENQLTQQATESDIDGLREIIKRWEAVLDPDGLEPTDEILRAKQGVFIRGKRQGLHRLEIAATPEQFEFLVTVMNTATNPRVKTTFAPDDGTPADPAAAADTLGGTAATAGAGPEWQGPTRPQKLLQGLVGACQIALSTDKLPSSGGHRPQIMINLDYQDLVNQIGASADTVFGGLISPKTVRKIACDADLIPLVLGGKGEILDIGRAQRLFTPAQRRALVARDKGCAFPDCTMPAPWTEAHHIEFWEKHNGPTSVHNGCLLCSYHHHLLHDENWRIEVRDGIPWFTPPRYIDPDQKPRRNRYRLAGTPQPRTQAQTQTQIVENGTVAEPPPQPAELSLVPASGLPAQTVESLLPLMERDTGTTPKQSTPPKVPSPPESPRVPTVSEAARKSRLSDEPQHGPTEDWNRPFDDWPLQPNEPPW